jgi:hypothetical protein
MGELVDLESDLPAEVAPEVIHPLILIKKVYRRYARLILYLVLIQLLEVDKGLAHNF